MSAADSKIDIVLGSVVTFVCAVDTARTEAEARTVAFVYATFAAFRFEFKTWISEIPLPLVMALLRALVASV